VEACYLLRLAEEIGVSDTVLKGLPEELLEAICLFMPGIYQEKVSQRAMRHWRNIWRKDSSSLSARMSWRRQGSTLGWQGVCWQRL
jgi:hypothetical protein